MSKAFKIESTLTESITIPRYNKETNNVDYIQMEVYSQAWKNELLELGELNYAKSILSKLNMEIGAWELFIKEKEGN